MKITIGGSVVFAREELEIKKKLEQAGHLAYVSEDLEKYADKPTIKMSFEEELALSLKLDVMRRFMQKITESDAYLVCNYPKKGIEGYLGTSVLMEIGVAYHLGKKIYLLHGIDRSQNYALEIAVIGPIILNGNLSLI